MRTATASTPDQAQQPVASSPLVVPFVQAAHEHVETVANFAVTPGAANTVFGPFDVPAYGYLRNLVIQVTTTTADTAGGTITPDYPFNLFDSIQFNDVNGAPIVGPLTGYSLMWANVVAAANYQPDPRLGFGYSNSGRSPQFTLRVPLEISTHDCLGSLANQDSAASYKLTMTTATRARLFSGGTGTGNMVLNVQVWAECYTVPNRTDMLGNLQEQAPPALGTAQYLSYNTQPTLVGNNTIGVKRVGNLIENQILIFRDGTGARNAACVFNPFTFSWDGRDMWQGVTPDYLQRIASERLNGSAIDTGVIILPFNSTTLSRMGNGPQRNMLPTTQSSRLEIRGSAATAGSIEIVTVDMSVAQVNPQGRYVLDSATGYNGRMVQGAQG